ncbi:MAG: hypothetical protein ABI562_04610 [Chloroflexota bacterium]
MLRFFLLRFLPRRLVPLLFVLEIFQLFRRWQHRNDPVIDPRRRRSAAGYRGGTETASEPWADRQV